MDPGTPPLEEHSPETLQMMAAFGGPAFLRRARRVDEAWRELTGALSIRRAVCLDMVRLRVGILVALAGDCERLAAMLPGAPVADVRTIHDECGPRLRAAVEPTES